MSFNITFSNQKQGDDIWRSGWSYVYDNLLPLSKCESPLLLDLYCDKTFNWKNSTVKLPYTKSWIGFCHHTFNTDFSDNNLVTLLDSEYFIQSAGHCKGLIVLSQYIEERLIEELANRDLSDIPVYSLVHPTELHVPQFSFNKFCENENKKIVHIGAWLRNVFFFYNLTLGSYDFSSKSIFSFNNNKETIQKVALKGKDMDNYFYTDEFINILRCSNPRNNNKTTPICRGGNGVDPVFNKWFSQYGNYISHLKNSVCLLDKLSNCDYDKLLTENIVIINLIDASAVNTVIECIARCTPIIVNKHPAIVEILGHSYPLYYNVKCIDGISNNFYQMNKEIDELLSKKGAIKHANDYLKKLDKTNLNINTFIGNLIKICSKCK